MRLIIKKKERINITVDPALHQRFSQYAERNNQSVSGILNEVMDIYCEDASRIDTSSPVAVRLRRQLLDDDRSTCQQIVRKFALDAGLTEVDLDETDPANTYGIPPQLRSEWVGTIGKAKVGVKLAYNLVHEPDITLGRGLLFRGTFKCDRVILVVPYKLAIPAHVLTATEQAGLELVGVDLLDTVLRSRTRKESSSETVAETPPEPTEGQKRVRNAKTELARMQSKRKEREAGARPAKVKAQ